MTPGSPLFVWTYVLAEYLSDFLSKVILHLGYVIVLDEQSMNYE